MSDWHPLIPVDALAPGAAVEVVVADRILAVYNVDGSFHVLDGICPHQGGPLGQGHLNGCVVTCPWHGWQFDVTTGHQQINPRIIHPGMATRVEGDMVHVHIPS